MLEELFHSQITLLVPDGTVTDGTVSRSESAATAIVCESENYDPRACGRRTTETVFLVRSREAPKIGTRILFEQRLYDVHSVRVCRDLSGNVLCYRCASR